MDAWGMNLAKGAKARTIEATAKADMTPDHWVMAPACWLMEERVSEPEPGMQWKNEPERLASPSERHCWLYNDRM